MNFCEALTFIRFGYSVRREDEYGCYKMVDDDIVYEGVDGYYREARFTSEDVLANDWEKV